MQVTHSIVHFNHKILYLSTINRYNYLHIYIHIHTHTHTQTKNGQSIV